MLGLVFLLLATSGCSQKLPTSLGRNYEIYVIADQAEWDSLGTMIKEIFEKTTITPQLEKVFEVIHVDPAHFSDYLDRKNLLILAALEPKSPTDELLLKALDKKAVDKIKSGQEYLFVARDEWAIGQFIMILASKDIPTLKANIEVFPDFIYDLFYQERDRRYKEELFWRTEAVLERKLRKDVGWTLKIPPRFRIEAEDPSVDRLVWLRRTYPDLNIFVHWEAADGPEALTSMWVDKKIRWIGAKYYDGARPVKDAEIFRRGTFHGKPAVQAYGLWEITDKAMGGPFRTIAFYDDETKKIYLLHLVVYAPTHRKEPLLRRLELIADTFSVHK
jgi:hypothetical protein